MMAPCILVPHHRAEEMTIAHAAEQANVSVRTMRDWCASHGLGRRIGGTLRVSRVALRMYREDAHDALAAYHAGERHGEAVAVYFRREGIGSILAEPCFQHHKKDCETGERGGPDVFSAPLTA